MIENSMITCDPRILAGKPVIAGTRISVELILEELGGGMTVEEFIEGYPHISKDQVFAALRFAANAIREDAIYPYSTLAAV